LIGLFVTGTGTGVGKTIVSSALAGFFAREGYSVGVFKPVQTGAERNASGILESQDTRFMASACGCDASAKLLNPYCFEPACSPHLAAEMAGEIIRPEKIKSAYQELSQQYDLIIIEGAGGLMVPLTPIFFICDLVQMLNTPLLIVSHNTLGTINHSILTIRQAYSANLKVLGVIFNHTVDSSLGFVEETNPMVVQDLTGVEVFGTIPYDSHLRVDRNLQGNTLKFIERYVNINSLKQKLWN
jgi:dethiobiotin synthetase